MLSPLFLFQHRMLKVMNGKEIGKVEVGGDESIERRRISGNFIVYSSHRGHRQKWHGNHWISVWCSHNDPKLWQTVKESWRLI